MVRRSCTSFPFFFFNDTATTEIYTLSLHDALPISDAWNRYGGPMERPHSARDVVAAVVYQVILAIVGSSRELTGTPRGGVVPAGAALSPQDGTGVRVARAAIAGVAGAPDPRQRTEC